MNADKEERKRVAELDRELDKLERRKGRKPWLKWLAGLVFFAAIGAPFAAVAAYRFFEAPGTILMVQRGMAGERISRSAKPLSQISPHLVRAVIAAEDARFCAHDGFDVEAIEKAMEFNEKQAKRGSARRRGASTISQQTAKNLFLWPQRSWVRKGAETYFTALIEAAWPKRRIMEAYLNAAEWGEGRFGAEAAAQGIFGKSAKDLTPAEAARLAAVLPSPRKWSAEKPGPYVRKRARTILARMEAVRAQGLDGCVLTPWAAPTPAEKKARENKEELDLAPLPPPPVGDAPEALSELELEALPEEALEAGPEIAPEIAPGARPEAENAGETGSSAVEAPAADAPGTAPPPDPDPDAPASIAPPADAPG